MSACCQTPQVNAVRSYGVPACLTDDPMVDPDAMPLSLGVGAGQCGGGRAGMADDLVGGTFDAVGVVPGAFDSARAGAVPTGWVGLLADFVDRVDESFVQVLRG